MIKYVITSTFGLEKITKTELIRLGYKINLVENGSITTEGTIDAIADLNINLRTADRVYIELAKFKAESFDELFDKIYNIPFEEHLSANAKFPIIAKSVKSKLFSKSDIQKISKKAIVKRLTNDYGINYFPEDEETCQINVNIHKDVVSVLLNTSGDALNKRGYRTKQTDAPLKETLAAGLILLSNWNHKKTMIDPMCGSGTLPIEAAMIELNIAPGLNRKFAAEDFIFVPQNLFELKKLQAKENIKENINLKIFAMDIDPKAIEIAKENAKNAGILNQINFSVADIKDLKIINDFGCLITNPPYGKRLGQDKEVLNIYKTIGEKIKTCDKYSTFVLTSNEQFEKEFGKKSTRNRKLYNGNIKCYYYQYISDRRY